MKKQSKLKTFFIKLILKIFFKADEPTRKVSDEAKREMCGRAIQSGVCPHSCESCAWNTLR